MTPLHATAQPVRGFAPAPASDLAVLATHARTAAHRAQPVEKVHEPIFRMHGRQAPRNRIRRPGRDIAVAAEAPARREPRESLARLSPVAKFGDSAPTMAQIIAHENGFLRAHTPNEMRAFSRHLPTEAYQATLDRSRFFMMDIPPLDAAA